ncbi:hypothetical protein [Nocardia sp. NPDC057668]|uniref:helix-turn-helix domain-containing protein n=1 Tax=Nocardia sp. NPDC057668 TaxID=3346202 RepID=UPI0036722AE2
MTTATAASTIDDIRDPVARFTRGWMLATSTDAYGMDLGFASGSRFWVVGRAGVLGDCPVEIAAAAIAFEPIEKVRAAWETVPAGLTHRDVALHYRDRIAAWGDRVFADHPPAELIELEATARRIAGAAPAALGVLFAGWRQLSAPESPGARAAVALHVLREMRGAAHIAAITACGLTPLDAILAAPHPPPRTGPAYAERMGWRGPFRDPAEVRMQRLAAEELTGTILEPYFSILTPGELARFGAGVTTLCETSIRVGDS